MNSDNPSQIVKIMQILDRVVDICELNGGEREEFYMNFWTGLVGRMLTEYQQVVGESLPVGEELRQMSAERAAEILKPVLQRFLAREEGVTKTVEYVDGFLASILDGINPELTDQQLNEIGMMFDELSG